MKERTRICELLGLTQHEIAMFLKVSRSQWSLFELGKRDLPLRAKSLLTEMLQHMQDAEKYAKNSSEVMAKRKMETEKLLVNNNYQTLAISRKIKTLEKKELKNSRALLLADYLSKRKGHTDAAKFIKGKISKSPEEYGLELFKCKVKLELLHVEKGLLETEIHKLS